MPTDPQIAEIAAGLSEAQRRVVVDAEWHGSGDIHFALIPCVGVSPLPGSLAYMHSLRWDRLTPLGVAVRNHLLSEDRNDG